MSVPSRRTRVGVYIENAGKFTQLEEWMSWAEELITAQAAAIDELRRQSSEIYRELTVVKSELHETRALAEKPPPGSDDLQHRMNHLDQRLNKILALFDDKLGGGQSEQGMLHHSYVKEYVSLVEQQILSLTVGIFRSISPRDKARFVAFVCDALFGSSEVHEQELMDALPRGASRSAIQSAREICANARTLRDKVARGRPQRWDFDYTAQAEIDPDWQEPWAGSVDDGVVDFVVAPAYVVDSDTLLAKQWVFIVSRTNGATPQEELDPEQG